DQKFEQARQWLHYMFNPTAGADCWNVEPFHAVATIDPVDELREILADVVSDPDSPRLAAVVNDWRKHPFQPWRVASTPRTAIQKAIVMKYLDVLVDWADSLFRQYTRETVNEAALLYMAAGRILGHRPTRLPGVEPTVETFATLRSRLDAFSNAVIRVETV